MRNWQAFRTHHKNQTQIALARSRVMRKISKGMKPGDASSGASVTYCEACGAPVVDSPQGRARHAQRGFQCAQALSLKKERAE